jgi:SAM-dependent methyltransferase
MLILRQTKAAVKVILPEPLVRRIQSLLFILTISRWRGLSLHLDFPDRYVLEDTIILYFVERQEFHKILFVGCEWYTKPYNRYFRAKEYWTIEIEPKKKKFGSKRHVVGSFLNLSDRFPADYFDLIIYTGVFGHGVNSQEDTEISFQQCFHCLRAGGTLVFGWDDQPEWKPFPVTEECQSLKQFEPQVFQPLSTTQYLVPNSPHRHTFNFYVKPVSG